MEDLLREKEFIQKTKYNPWKRFIVFFCIAILHTLLNYFIGSKFKNGSSERTFLALLEIIMPFILLYFMFFYKWKYHSSIATNILAIFLLMLFDVLTIILLNTINPADRIITENEYMNGLINTTKTYFVFFLLCSIIIIPVTIKRNKSKNYI